MKKALIFVTLFALALSSAPGFSALAEWGDLDLVPAVTSAPTARPTPTPEPIATPEPVTHYRGKMTASHSSYLKGNKYAVDGGRVIDKNEKTAWNEGAKGDGIGEWVEIALEDGQARTLSGFHIINGYAKAKNIYDANHRVQDLDLVVDGEYVATFTLEDSMDWQTLKLPEPIAGVRFRFVIQSVYKGTKYKDACITEIELF